MSSPLRRTIYSALEAFGPVFEREQSQLLVHPDFQETSDAPCDTGSDAGTLRNEVERKHLPVDLRMIHDSWNKVRESKLGLQCLRSTS